MMGSERELTSPQSKRNFLSAMRFKKLFGEILARGALRKQR
jgi:hypothetical protein